MLNKLAQFFKRDPKPPTPEEEVEPEDAEEGEEGEERVFARDERDTQSWVGVGLDGVLAQRGDAGLAGEIGPPIPDMVSRVKDWVKYKHLRVRVLTPRAATEEGANQVRIWLEENNLSYLEFTSQKDLHMVEFWDDQAVQVISNLGVVVGHSPNALDQPPETDQPAPSENAEDADNKNETT